MSPSTAAPASLAGNQAADDGARPSRRLVLAVAAFVLALGLLGYGAQGGFRFGPPEPVAADASDSLQVQALVAELTQRLQLQPDDAESWTLLARVQAERGQQAQSLAAFRRVVELQPRNAQALADLGEALALARQGELDGEAEKLVLRAVRLDPRNLKALALAGGIAFQRGQYPEALVFWQRALRDATAPGVREPLQAAIAEARQRAASPRPAASAGR